MSVCTLCIKHNTMQLIEGIKKKMEVLLLHQDSVLISPASMTLIVNRLCSVAFCTLLLSIYVYFYSSSLF